MCFRVCTVRCFCLKSAAHKQCLPLITRHDTDTIIVAIAEGLIHVSDYFWRAINILVIRFLNMKDIDECWWES